MGDIPPLNVLMEQAAALKTAQLAQERIRFDSWDSWYQHSLFAREDVLALRLAGDFESSTVFAKDCKEKGNAFYKAGDLNRAINEYERSLSVFEWIHSLNADWKSKGIQDRLLEEDRFHSSGSTQTTNGSETSATQMDTIRELKISNLLNLSMCFCKSRDWDQCIRACNRVLELDPASVKALYRRAQARIIPASCGVEENRLALADLKSATLIKPADGLLASAYGELKVSLSRQKKKDREVFGRLFEQVDYEERERERGELEVGREKESGIKVGDKDGKEGEKEEEDKGGEGKDREGKEDKGKGGEDKGVEGKGLEGEGKGVDAGGMIDIDEEFTTFTDQLPSYGQQGARSGTRRLEKGGRKGREREGRDREGRDREGREGREGREKGEGREGRDKESGIKVGVKDGKEGKGGENKGKEDKGREAEGRESRAGERGGEGIRGEGRAGEKRSPQKPMTWQTAFTLLNDMESAALRYERDGEHVQARTARRKKAQLQAEIAKHMGPEQLAALRAHTNGGDINGSGNNFGSALGPDGVPENVSGAPGGGLVRRGRDVLGGGGLGGFKGVDLANPSPQVVQDAKNRGLDIKDPRVQMLIQEIEKVRQAHCTGDDVDVLDARREAERIEQYIFEAQDNIRREEAGRVSDTLMNDIPPSLAKSMVTRRLRLMDREEKEEQQLKELKQWHGGAAVAAVDGGDGDENGVLTLNGVGNGGSDEVGVVGRLGLGVGVNIGKTLRTPTRRLGTQLTTKTLSLGKNPEQLRATLRALMVEDIMDLRANFDENEGKGEWTGVDEEEEVRGQLCCSIVDMLEEKYGTVEEPSYTSTHILIVAGVLLAAALVLSLVVLLNATIGLPSTAPFL